MKRAIILFLLVACTPAVELGGHNFTFQHTDTTYELTVAKNGEPVTGINMQGQIMTMDQHDIYYAPALETTPGTYSFNWTPRKGDYYVQFIFRADNTTLKPTFPITISKEYEMTANETAIHWHSHINITLCGTPYYLPQETGDLNKQHTHAEKDKLHLHAMINPNMDELVLGNLFEQLNVTFNNTCFDNYCNEDKCPDGSAGNLQMTVNGKENNEFNNYKWKDNDTIIITFG